MSDRWRRNRPEDVRTALVLDGVYVHADDDPRSPLEFRELDTSTHVDIAEVATRTAARVERILRAHGRCLDPERDDGDAPEVCLDEPGLAACYAADAAATKPPPA